MQTGQIRLVQTAKNGGAGGIGKRQLGKGLETYSAQGKKKIGFAKVVPYTAKPSKGGKGPAEPEGINVSRSLGKIGEKGVKAWPRESKSWTNF